MDLSQHDFRPIDRSTHELLIVDDDPVSRYATARVLRHAGFRTREAADGAQGLAAAQEGAISAMVVDVHLPDIDGFELCRILRSREITNRLPVLHLSAAYVTDEDKVRGLDSGADAYLTHPVEPSVLVATVQALVRTRVAEDAMRRTESKFRAIYEQAPSGIALLDDAGAVIDANPAMLRLMSCTLDEMMGRRIGDFAPAELVADVENFLAGALRDGDTSEFPMLTRAGGVVYVEWRVTPRIEPGTHMVVATDVSQRALLEQQRQQLLDRERMARGEAEKVSRMKDTFIAVLSHELRAPLNAIMGWTHVLKKRGGTEDAMRGIQAIERNGQIQARLISDLLDMSRLNIGKLPLSLETLDPAEAITSAVNAMAPSFDEHRIDLQLELDPPYRAIRADGSRLQQIVWNLLSNAVKFSHPGGRIVVSLMEHEDRVVIAVRDEGQGIAPEFLPLVFDRFTQGDAGSNRHRGGLGLGLSIVRQLTEAHGGSVRVSSEGLGRGATFEIHLPLLTDEQPADLSQTEAPHHVAEAPDSHPGPLDDSDAALAGVNLLVVDDDPEATTMLNLILGERGAQVRTAHDYDSALAALDTAPVDLLVSDIGMPGRDGYDLIREIRRRELLSLRHLPAIALTAFNRQQDQDQARAAGFDAHAAKPLEPLKLVNAVQRLLARTGD